MWGWTTHIKSPIDGRYLYDDDKRITICKEFPLFSPSQIAMEYRLFTELLFTLLWQQNGWSWDLTNQENEEKTPRNLQMFFARWVKHGKDSETSCDLHTAIILKRWKVSILDLLANNVCSDTTKLANLTSLRFNISNWWSTKSIFVTLANDCWDWFTHCLSKVWEVFLLIYQIWWKKWNCQVCFWCSITHLMCLQMVGNVCIINNPFM